MITILIILAVLYFIGGMKLVRFILKSGLAIVGLIFAGLGGAGIVFFGFNAVFLAMIGLGALMIYRAVRRKKGPSLLEKAEAVGKAKLREGKNRLDEEYEKLDLREKPPVKEEKLYNDEDLV